MTRRRRESLVADSRFLAYVLRHDPAAIGIELEDGGWVDVDVLLAALAANGRPLEPERLDRLVSGMDKPRFERAGGRIRATHGHSVDVDIRRSPAVPPPVLYHGTVERFLPRILAEGLVPGSRTHVHLSATPEAASVVGSRRGRPGVLRVDAAAMHAEGHVFHAAPGGVWLTPHVPASHLAAGSASGSAYG